MATRNHQPPPLEPKEFRSVDEIDRAIQKLERRIRELEQLDVPGAVLKDSGADDVAESNVRATIREVFGQNSPEFKEHEYIRISAGPTYKGMDPQGIIEAKERGRTQVLGILRD